MLAALGIKNIKLRHVRADPRDLEQLRRSIDLSKINTALVLAGAQWVLWQWVICTVVVKE